MSVIFIVTKMPLMSILRRNERQKRRSVREWEGIPTRGLDGRRVLCQLRRVSSVGDETLEEAWAEALESWDEDDAHKRFIAVCDAIGRLDEAGARYRAVKESDPERAQEADRRIDQVLGRALATLQSKRVEPSEEPRRRLFWVSVVLFLAILLSTMWMIRGL